MSQNHKTTDSTPRCFFSDLDDVRLAMSCLELMRDSDYDMSLMVDSVENIFTLLGNKKLSVPDEILNDANTLRYGI